MPQANPEPRWRTIRIGRGRKARTVKVRVVPKRTRRSAAAESERPQ